MATIADIRKQFPQYADVSDSDLAQAFHQRYYKDIPFDQFATEIGLVPPKVSELVPKAKGINEIAQKYGGSTPQQLGIDVPTTETGKLIARTAQGVTKGLVNPAIAAMQAIPATREVAQALQEGYQQTRKELGGTGFDVPELVGAVANPINRFLPGGAYTGGAVGAITQPLEGKDLSTMDVLTGKITQAAGGAVLGKIADNLISSITPQLKEGARELIDQGVPVSPGQAYEGVPGWLFRQIESFGLGPRADKVNKAFNPVVGNEVLSSIGQELPKTVAPGQATVRLVQRRIENYYTDSLNKLGRNALDTDYKTTMGTILDQTRNSMSAESREQFINSLNAQIGGRMSGKNGQLDGSDIKSIQEWLKGEVSKYSKGADRDSIGLNAAYGDTLANLNQYISRIDKDGLIAKADEAWAKLYSFADASKRANQKGGIFNPEQLSQAVANQAATILTAGGGRAPLNETAQKALNVLGKQEPVGLLKGAMIASKAATGFATTFIMPQVAIPILLASGTTYAAAKGLMSNPSALRLAVKQALEKNPGVFGSASTQFYQQLLKEDAETQ
jgi:hypothetical protein